MNETLSTLIAFVGVLIVFSMLTQAVQEAVKNLFTLKAGVWEEFLRRLYRREFDLRGTTPGLLARMWGAWSREPVDKFEARLNRLRDVVTQSTDLLRSARADLKQIGDCPGTSPDPRATVAPALQSLQATLAAIAKQRLGAFFSVYSQIDQEGTLGKLEQSIKQFAQDRIAKFEAQAAGAAATALGELQAACAELSGAIDKTEKRLSEYKQLLEQRYDAFASEVDSQYRGHMLQITVWLGCAFVLIFNADAFSIYRQLSTSPQSRAVAVARAQDMAKTGLASRSDALNDIHALLRDEKVDQASTAALAFCDSLGTDFTMLKDEASASKATDIKARIQAATTKSDASDGGKALLAIEPEMTALYLGLNREAVETYVRDVSALDLPLGWSQDWRSFKSTVGAGAILHALASKLAGLLLTVFLITFGAPFWNDVLNALVGMKNALGKPK